MPKILIVSSNADSIVNFRGALIRKMIANGHSVDVSAPDGGPEIRNDIKALGVQFHPAPLGRTSLNPVQDIKYFLHLRRLIKASSPDVVLTYTIKPNIWGGLAAGACNAKSVSMITGLGYAFTTTNKPSIKQRMVRSISRILFRCSTKFNARVIFQNPDDRHDFIEMGCLRDPAKARLVNGSGVDMQHYTQTALPDAPIFVMVARLLKNKGVFEYGEAALRVLKANPDARCLLVGGFDEGHDSIDKADLDRWVQGGLEYLGPQKDIRPFMAQASVFVLPSFYREGTPRSALEAMAMGRAIVTTDAPGCRETVTDGTNGYLVPTKDIGALSQAMLKLANNPKMRLDMGQASHTKAAARFEVDKVNQTMFEYLDLAPEPNVSPPQA